MYKNQFVKIYYITSFKTFKKLSPEKFENKIFMDEIEKINGELWMPGNRTLISFNLSRNFKF